MFSELKNILFHTKKNFFSTLYGEHSSIFNGSGLDFNEVREYAIDDDIRHINWKITARTRVPSVNLFFDHKKINICAVYLCSGSLNFGKERSKQDIATELISSLSYLSLYHKDNFSSLFFDKEEKNFFQLANDKYTPHRLFEYAKTLDIRGSKIEYKNLQNTILEKIKTRSILFIIGDFLQLPELGLLTDHYEIYVLIVRDKNEEELHLKGEYNLIDTNTLNKHHLLIDDTTVKDYNSYMKTYDEKLFAYFKEHNIAYHKFYTDQNPIKELRYFLGDFNGR